MAEVVGTYYAHGTHTKFAAVLKDVVLTTTNTTYTITITATGRHYNNDSTANTVSVTSFTASVTKSGNGTISTSQTYPSSTVSVPAGVGQTADGNTLTFTITGDRTTTVQTISSITFNLKSTISNNTSTAVWTSSIEVPALTSYNLVLYKRGADVSASSETKTGYYYNTSKAIPTMTTLGWKKPGTFLGWATSAANATAGTVAYADGANVSLTSNLSLYAIWRYPVRVKTSGAWKQAAAYVKVNGVWKVATGVYCKVNGTWKQIGT